ncbi:LysR family transcriptional regulator [Skermanella sp. TT6]|uniref:LysR family transcriptional regulator n=1 Tax=Skermanella cutis TaxID=2775420 RepID=A0ABX7AZT1_9PROT|nr:LysR family transcriptional regulator [Skermanella sp. TT6]QQP87583.1 LysR family transcriptional regulator [Skermanella sp. TT6]
MAQQRELDKLGNQLDWNLLRTFMVIVQEGSITAAANRLFLTQPAVSLALKRLEARLGREMIERGQGRFRVTEAGETIYREVVDIYGTISRFGILVREIHEEISGHVRIFMTSRIQTVLFDRVLTEFHARYPKVTFRIDVIPSTDIHIALQQKIGTLGICLMREPIPGLRSEVLIHQTYHLYCGRGHRFYGTEGLDVADLRKEDFVSFTTDQIDGTLSPLAVFRAREGFGGRIVGASANLEEVRRMIVCGLGLGPLPEHTAARDVADGELWELPPYEGVAPVDVHLIWNPQSKFNRAEIAFREMLLAEIRDLPVDRRLPT